MDGNPSVAGNMFLLWSKKRNNITIAFHSNVDLALEETKRIYIQVWEHLYLSKQTKV